MSKPRVTADRLRQLLAYEQETGIFRCVRARAQLRAGDIAGSRNVNGYWYIGVDRRYYTAHRLAWLFMTGDWPPGDIDHIDGNPLNNRWANLRQVTEHANLQNQRRAHRNSRSGLLGVSPFGKRWQSRIRVAGRDRHIGTFDTAEQAHLAYLNAKRVHHPGCTI